MKSELNHSFNFASAHPYHEVHGETYIFYFLKITSTSVLNLCSMLSGCWFHRICSDLGRYHEIRVVSSESDLKVSGLFNTDKMTAAEKSNLIIAIAKLL